MLAKPVDREVRVEINWEKLKTNLVKTQTISLRVNILQVKSNARLNPVLPRYDV